MMNIENLPILVPSMLETCGEYRELISEVFLTIDFGRYGLPSATPELSEQEDFLMQSASSKLQRFRRLPPHWIGTLEFCRLIHFDELALVLGTWQLKTFSCCYDIFE